MARSRTAALIAAARRTDKRLFDWMHVEHDILLVELGNGRIDWRPMRRVIGDLRLVDDRGDPPSIDTIARTWARVRRTVAAQRAATALKPGEIAPGVRLVAPLPEPGRRPALGSAPPQASPVSRPAPPTDVRTTPPVSRKEVAAQIEQALDTLGSLRVPIPERTPHRS